MAGRADLTREIFVKGLEGTRQQKYRDVGQLRILLDGLAQLVAVRARHHDVCQDHVRLFLASSSQGIITIVGGDELEIFVGETQSHELLDDHAVVGEKHGLGHQFSPLSRI